MLQTKRHTDGWMVIRTDMLNLLIYVQNSLEWYITHWSCSKKHEQHENQYISQRYSMRHNKNRLGQSPFTQGVKSRCVCALSHRAWNHAACKNEAAWFHAKRRYADIENVNIYSHATGFHTAWKFTPDAECMSAKNAPEFHAKV